ncbi:MAG: glutathione S-transferase family protein [Gallionellaceae bacterium]
MTIILYDLSGAEDERRFSPNCWRIKMALAHKGLEFEAIPWRFAERDAIAFSGQGAVPVIVDGPRTVSDSWGIALYLDDAYPERPMLMDSEQARGAIFVFKHWCERNIHPAVFQAIVLDLFTHLHNKDKAYFRESREKRLGTTLEAYGSGRTGALAKLHKALDTVRPVLIEQPFIGGRSPSFADYILFGAFQWARVMSPIRLLEPDDPVYLWRERMLDIHGGIARSALSFPG